MVNSRLHRQPARSGDLKRLLRYVEDHASELRRRAGVGMTERLDPRSLTDELGVKIVGLHEIQGLSDEDRDHLATVDPSAWSGAGLALPDGSTLVILHPRQTPERATSTIMEEACHAYYGHAPSQLVTLPGGITKREYNLSSETEAYWTAAAALLPAKVVAMAVWRGTARDLPAQYGVSIELVEFRIKTLGLWRQYHPQEAA